ncbi:Extensin family protein [Rhizobium sp. PDO1-076]|uniref:extensin family protein n=1 Tax=Rhizobium sp. PDO1-076 TaxID=1125979 RepID=UPI00024E29B5|nr:extensin family protein [Rhizobium sp. PDO1-076]EHS50424.1 Extensin family protein [Rhizobium sp. PDO1-076]
MRNFLGVSLAMIWLIGASLPARGPTPEEKPQVAAPVPKPADKPEAVEPAGTAKEADEDDAPDAVAPDDAGSTQPPPPAASVPATKPDLPPAPNPAPEKAPEPAPEPKTPPPTVVTEDEAGFKACTAALKDLGATFEQPARIDDGNGCGIDRPITLTRLSPTVALEPAGTFRCETALQLARMTRDMIAPAAKLGLSDKGALKTVNQASGYICRNRNSAENGKISEHARGNAVDIAALTFERGTVPMVIAKQDDGTFAAAFQRSLNAMACLYFTTVLSPGSDAAHQDHLHLDVIKRNSGFRYCR